MSEVDPQPEHQIQSGQVRLLNPYQAVDNNNTLTVGNYTTQIEVKERITKYLETTEKRFKKTTLFLRQIGIANKTIKS